MIFGCFVQFLQRISCSHGKNLNNFEIILSDQMIWKVQIYHQHTVDNMMVYINYLANFVHGEPKMD